MIGKTSSGKITLAREVSLAMSMRPSVVWGAPMRTPG